MTTPTTIRAAKLSTVNWNNATYEDVHGKSHRELYPEQYQHPMIGRRAHHKNNRKICGTVSRVVSSMFGQLAFFEETEGKTAYAIRDLEAD